ncbi:MAG: GlsB/YeaQ/YmgE family stress response membrane protein [Pseudolabrys sp.]
MKTYSVSSARRLRAPGWAAEHFMKSDTGLLMNIGPQVAVVGTDIKAASTKGGRRDGENGGPPRHRLKNIFSFIGFNLGGWLGYLISGFVGACLLIWIVRTVRGTRPV